MVNQYRLKTLCFCVLQALAGYAFSAPVADANSDANTAVDAPAVVTVFGEGQTRQVQNITQEDLAKALPGTSPLKTLEKLPGVSFTSADPFGSYEWSTRFSVRGFNQNQMGFTLDGIPLGDMSYGNNNGLHISRAISSENIGRVTLSQGAGAVGTASTSNLGGTVQFFSSDPSNKMELTGAQTFGSDSTYRTFARYDTGLLDSGTKAYISVTRQRAEKWKGDGPQDQDMVNAKLVHNFGDNKLSVFFDYSNRDETDYQDMSLDMTRRLGWNWDNYAPDWQRAVNAAKGIFTGGVNSLDDAYYLGRGLRKDYLGGVSLDNKLTESTDLKTTYYHHSDKGQGQWYTPYTPSSATVPISIRTTEYSIGRDGVTSDLTWYAGQNTVNGGIWAERSLHTLTRNYYAITGPDNSDFFLSNPMATAFQQDFTTTTTQFYLQDTVSMLNNSLTANFGFKSPRVTIDATDIVGTRAAGTLTASKNFLPQLGLSYAVNKQDELFASVAENMRAFQPGVSGPFSQSQTAFDLSKGSIKPETSTTFDLGYRFNRGTLSGSLTVYHADFKDRLISVATCAGIVGCPSTFVNVGSVGTNGLEAAAVWKISPQVSWFNSFTYNDSKYKDNYSDSGVIVPVSGKQVVDSPKKMFTTELSYEQAGWFGRVESKFTDKRFYTYTNDGQVPSFVVTNLSGGYKQASLVGLHDVTIQLNVDNVLSKKYYATIGSNGFPETDPNGTNQTLLPGAPRQLFLTFSGKL